MEMEICKNVLAFSDKFWTEDECLYKSDNGDLEIVKLVGKNLSVIVSTLTPCRLLRGKGPIKTFCSSCQSGTLFSSKCCVLNTSLKYVKRFCHCGAFVMSASESKHIYQN